MAAAASPRRSGLPAAIHRRVDGSWPTGRQTRSKADGFAAGRPLLRGRGAFAAGRPLPRVPVPQVTVPHVTVAG